MLDFGCGNGRHALELARKGISVTGVDMVDRFVTAANSRAHSQGLYNAEFITGDCRSILLNTKFDHVICLYDVIGSHPLQSDNDAILANAVRHLRTHGRVLISVMNREVAARLATIKANISRNPDALLSLPPSPTMQDSGQIWDPKFFLLDPVSNIIYRKEQFEVSGLLLPCELVVRDRRYLIDEFVNMCTVAGLSEIWTKRVQVGRWDTALPGNDNKAKELLFLGEKS